MSAAAFCPAGCGHLAEVVAEATYKPGWTIGLAEASNELGESIALHIVSYTDESYRIWHVSDYAKTRTRAGDENA